MRPPADNRRPVARHARGLRDLRERYLPDVGPEATYAIKVTEDQDSSPLSEPAEILSGAFYLGIPPELDGWYVVKFWGYQTTPGFVSGDDTVLRLTRTAQYGPTDTITTTQVTIPYDGLFPSVDAVIDDTVNQVTGNATLLRVDITNVNGAYGIGVEITLSPTNVLL